MDAAIEPAGIARSFAMPKLPRTYRVCVSLLIQLRAGVRGTMQVICMMHTCLGKQDAAKNVKANIDN